MIRHLGPSDLPILFEIVRLSQSHQFNWDNTKLQSEWSQCEAFGWAEEGKIVAFLFLADRGSAGELVTLATHPDHRKLHCMEKLIQGVLDSHGRMREFWLEVHEKNVAARNLYEKLGFIKVGERPRYYSDGGKAILYSRTFPL